MARIRSDGLSPRQDREWPAAAIARPWAAIPKQSIQVWPHREPAPHGEPTVWPGILTTLAEASEDFASALEWSESVGPLMGKTILAVGAFVVSWAILYAALRGKDPNPNTVFIWTAILLAAGFLLTFPTFFQLFAPAE